MLAVILASLVMLADAFFRADHTAMEEARATFLRPVANESKAEAAERHYRAALTDWLLSQSIGGDSQRAVAAARRADASLVTALELDPNHVHAYILRSRVTYILVMQNAIDSKEAFQRMQETHTAAKKLAPDDPLVVMSEAIFRYYSPRGDKAEGKVLFRKAIDLFAASRDPESAIWLPFAWNGYGSIMLGEGAYDEAREAFDTALRIRPDYAYVKTALLPMTEVVEGGAAPKAGGKWTTFVSDGEGDGRVPALADLRAVSWRRDGKRVWFRFELAADLDPSRFGVNLALDVDGDPANGNGWWAGNTAFRYDRLVTVWVGRGKDGRYRGTTGVADAADVTAGRFVAAKDVRFALEPRAILVGVDRKVLGKTARVVATVGTNVDWNDVAPMEGAATIAP